MVSTRRQSQLIIKQFNNININHPVQMTAMNNVLSPFEGNIHFGYPTGVKLYLQATKEIYKETSMLYISVYNSKDILYCTPSSANKYGWGRLAFMVNSGTGAKNFLE